MPSLKAIRRRISSVMNTKQITRAMKLVSTAKLRRAQEGALGGAGYGQKLGRVLERVRLDLPAGFSHPLLEPRAVRNKRIVMIAAERGLCGGFNMNVFKAAAAEPQPGEVKHEFVPIGRKMVGLCRQRRLEVVAEYEGLGEDISAWPIREIAASVMDDYMAGRCDEVVLYYTNFESLVSQSVVREQLLPLEFSSSTQAESENSALLKGMTRYDPRPEQILAYLLPQLVRTKLRQAALESKASEHAARMRAMDSATRNADELIGKLRLHYNRARQRSITTELIDIVGGAEALK